MYKLIRPLLFSIDAESVHHLAMKCLRFFLGFRFLRGLVRKHYHIEDDRLRQRLFNLSFDNPVGLAAGFDKNAQSVNELAALGFGSIEIGTVTGLAQAGNERPRLFRLPDDNALLNRMGFNNQGSETIATRLQSYAPESILGVNIGKSKAIPLEQAAEDYEQTFRALFVYADYFVVNVSSPNTPGLRTLQGKEPLQALLRNLQEVNDELAQAEAMPRKPVLLKIAPDLSFEEIDDVLEVIELCQIDGIVATNTTINRNKLTTADHEALGAGGLSGRPVRSRSVDIIRHIYSATQGRLPIIGVGGIFSANDALETIRAGASLVQVWTGFVYEGPNLIQDINRTLRNTCRDMQLENISQLVGQSE
jgi:dihydroorotate dehydrogenase